MQLARYEAFESLLVLGSGVESATIGPMYRFYNDKWFGRENIIVDDKHLLKLLASIRKLKQNYYRPASSKTSYLYISEIDCIIFADFVSPPREATQSKIYHSIKSIYDNCKNAFDASHDFLTGLYNKSALHQLIVDSITETNQANSESNQEISIPNSVCVIAMDIDHFKQVNDSYGHLYGDLVLQCFARRIELCCHEIEAASAGKLSLYCARPSGEEFNVVVKGMFDKEYILALGEKLRLCIYDNPLPTDAESDQMLGREHSSEITIPMLTDRVISASIGIVLSPQSISQNVNVLARSLLNCADIALYRAKTGGRNTVRLFEDIQQYYGTILEHHSDTNIVSIDIGRQVNVVPGQEFIVFHPDFSGKTPFYYSDGRSRKRLGYYPRYSCGRIEVFDVQEEISFCRVLESDNNMRFPVGSLLESVPIGSISHLIMKDIKGSSLFKQNSIAKENVQNALKNIIDKKSLPLVTIFSLLDMVSTVKNRGGAFVNSCLAELYEAVRTNFPITATLGQLQNTQIAVVVPDSDEFDHNATIHNILDGINTKYSGVITVVAGAYSPNEAKTVGKGDQSSLDNAHALSYASYSLSDFVVTQSNPIAYFNAEIASEIMEGWLQKRDFRQAIADYNEFCKIGIKYHLVENKLSNLAFSVREYEVALKHATIASELFPDGVILTSNSALMNFAAGNKLKAYDEFVKAEGMQSGPLNENYLLTYGLSMYEKFKVSPMEIDKNRLIELLTSGFAASNKINFMKHTREDIDSIIADIEAT